MSRGLSAVVVSCAALGAGALVAGCGGSGGSTSATPSRSSSATTPTSSSSSSAPRSRRHGPALAPVGRTRQLSAYGSTLHVTVTRVIDPLAYHAANVVPGTRPVGVEVRIADVAGATYDSTASGDWSLQLSPGSPDATPLDIKSGVCETPLVDFESAIYGGDVRPGCVAFSLPAHARIRAVVFSPHATAAKAVRWR